MAKKEIDEGMWLDISRMVTHFARVRGDYMASNFFNRMSKRLDFKGKESKVYKHLMDKVKSKPLNWQGRLDKDELKAAKDLLK
jgi:hypothetical protein